jgi:DNA-binding MarR family transcriptional regulator
MLGKHPSTLTGVLARLEERGMITREIDAEDRRRARFTLTAAGKKIDRERRGTVEAATRRALARAGDQSITEMLSVIAILIEELDRPD